MWKYLDEMYPHVVQIETKFGNVVFNGDIYFDFNKVVKSLVDMFDCVRDEAIETLHEWKNCRPIMVKIKTSTNESVLVHKTTEINCVTS